METEKITNPLLPSINFNKDKIRKTNFSDSSFSNSKAMSWEMRNDFATSYSTLNDNARSLLYTGLTCAHNINSLSPYTEEELNNGIKLSVPIVHVAKMMGFEIDESNNYYRAIKKAAKELRGVSFMIEDPTNHSFDVFGIVDRVIYNPDNDGQVYFLFDGGSSQYFLNNSNNFTLYSLLLTNKEASYANKNVVAIHNVLKTHLFKAESSEEQKFRVYYDFVDFRCMLGLINIDDVRVKDILESSAFREYKEDKSIAAERQSAIAKLDEGLENVIGGRTLKVTAYNEYREFKRKVLVPAQKVFINCIKEMPDLMQMMFEFEPVKYRNKVIGIIFDIYTIEGYKKKEKSNGVQMSLFDDFEFEFKYEEQRKINEEASAITKRKAEEVNNLESRPKKMRKKETMEETIELLSNYVNALSDNSLKISIPSMATFASKYDFSYIKDKYDYMLKQDNIKEPTKYLSSALSEDYDTTIIPPKQTVKKGSFHDFEQRNDYDFDEIERVLLNK